MPVYQYPEPDTIPTQAPTADPGYAAPDVGSNFAGDPNSQIRPAGRGYSSQYDNHDQNAEDQWVAEHVTSKGYVIDEVTGDVYDPKAYPPKIVDRMPDFYPAN